MTALSITSTLPLKHTPGAKMPVIALGVYQSKGAYQSCQWALENSYRHIDSARVYRNEAEVGQAVWDAISQGKFKRDEVFLTTKVYGGEHGTAKAQKAVKSSSDLLAKIGDGMGTWDLCLLHDPTAGKEKRLEAWRVLVQAKKEGKIKSIGVSNFSVKHMEEVAKEAGGGIEVNQIELHPWLQQKDIVEYCQRENIIVQAYCPIVRAQRNSEPALVEIAERHQRTPAQVLIRWSLQKGYVPLPKSDHEERIKENIAVFGWELDSQAMKTLNDLDMGPKGACSWNPVNHL